MGEEKCSKQDVQRGIADKRYGIGIRHLQMFCMTFTMIVLFIARASMGVAVLAMSSDKNRNETNNYTDIYRNDSYSNDSININFNLETYNNCTSEDCTFSDNYYFESNRTYIASNDDFEIFENEIETYDWDKKTQSLILSSFFWGYVCMQIPAGALAKKFGGKPILLVAIVSNAIICCAVPVLAALGGWMLVCACRITMGLTQACLFPATQTLLGQWLPDSERTSFVGIVFGGIQIGTIIAMPISGILADTTIGWKLIFYFVSGLLIINSVIWYWFAASSPREHRMISKEERQYIEAGLNVSDEKRPSTPWKYILCSIPVWVLLAPHMGFAMSFVLFFVDMPTYLEKGLQISLKNSAILSALPYIGMWFGSVFASFLSEWIYNKGLLSLTVSRKLFQSIAQFGIAVGLVVLSFLGPESKSIAVVTLIGILTASGFVSAGFIVNQLDLSPNYAGVIISVLNFFANFGSVLMPIATSYILQNDSSNVARWRWVFLFMAVCSTLTAIVYILFGTCKRQPWDDPNFLNKMKADPEEIRPVLEKEGENKEKINGANGLEEQIRL